VPVTESAADLRGSDAPAAAPRRDWCAVERRHQVREQREQGCKHRSRAVAALQQSSLDDPFQERQTQP
jgi:hypothetical protein